MNKIIDILKKYWMFLAAGVAVWFFFIKKK